MPSSKVKGCRNSDLLHASDGVVCPRVPPPGPSPDANLITAIIYHREPEQLTNQLMDRKSFNLQTHSLVIEYFYDRKSAKSYRKNNL